MFDARAYRQRPTSKSYYKGQPNKYMTTKQKDTQENNKTRNKKKNKVQAVLVRYCQSERLKELVEMRGLIMSLGTLFQMDTTECLKEDL